MLSKVEAGRDYCRKRVDFAAVRRGNMREIEGRGAFSEKEACGSGGGGGCSGLLERKILRVQGGERTRSGERQNGANMSTTTARSSVKRERE